MDASRGAPPQEGGRDSHARLFRYHPACRPRHLAGVSCFLQHPDHWPEGVVQHPLDLLCYQNGAKNRLHRGREAVICSW
uniref:Uncharacterized protein n=1 Tax=Arundo donax TaxID=35708 RepID=A0A0A9FSK3_ARUDO